MIFKQMPNIKEYNKDGSKIDPFCCAEGASNNGAPQMSYDGALVNDMYIWSETLRINNYVDTYGDHDEYNYVDIAINLELTSSDGSVTISQTTAVDDNTGFSYPVIDLSVNPETIDLSQVYQKLDEKVDKSEVLGLNVNGVRSAAFAVNYGNTSAAKNSYVPICEVEAFNYGKSSLCFEIIGREDSFGFTAKYYFSSRCWEDVDCSAGASQESNFSFLGSCYINSGNGEQYFDNDDIVVVETGHKTKNSKRGSKYVIYRKIRSAVWGDINNAIVSHSATATMSNFYIINVLYEDTPGYCTIKWYYTGDTVESYPNRSSFPAQGLPNYVYLANDTKFVYRWQSGDYVLSTNKTDLLVNDSSYLRLSSNVGRTTFTDYNDGTTKNIADYATSATFINS